MTTPIFNVGDVVIATYADPVSTDLISFQGKVLAVLSDTAPSPYLVQTPFSYAAYYPAAALTLAAT